MVPSMDRLAVLNKVGLLTLMLMLSFFNGVEFFYMIMAVRVPHLIILFILNLLISYVILYRFTSQSKISG